MANNPDFNPYDVIEAAFKNSSMYVPTLSLLAVNQRGSVALFKPKSSQGIKFLETFVYKPKPKSTETIHDKVVAAARIRTNAMLGPHAVLMADLVTPVPHPNRVRAVLDKSTATRWPNAVGKLIMPTVVPMIVSAPDPMERYDVQWVHPIAAVDILRENHEEHGVPQTLSSLQSLRTSMPIIESFTPTRS